jgi:hypothetical protein
LIICTVVWPVAHIRVREPGGLQSAVIETPWSDAFRYNYYNEVMLPGFPPAALFRYLLANYNIGMMPSPEGYAFFR